MERSRKIFLKIAAAFQQVISAANEYADRMDMLTVPPSHFRLEEEMERISVSSECIAGFLAKSSSRGHTIDDRLKDWLGTKEPLMCLETLGQTERLLRDTSSESRASMRMGTRGISPREDKIDRAVNLFDSRRGYFHFLFTIEVWNQEYDNPVQSFFESSPVTSVQTKVGTITPVMGSDFNEYLIRPKKIFQPIPKAKDGKLAHEILAWINGLNCAEKQDVTLSLRQPDTCMWWFGTPQYHSWMDNEASCLWLRGKPGAGKSVIASVVINFLENTLQDGGVLAFFYCDFRNERSTSAAEVMRSILSQVLRTLQRDPDRLHHLFDDLAKVRDRGGATLSDPRELAGYLARAADVSAQKPVIVIDGLDECKDVQKLLEGLISLKDHIRLLVTSRPLQIIKDGLVGFPSVSMDDMADKVFADIKLHVKRELDARRRLRDLAPAFKEEIRSVLCNKADGMFRWVQCSIDTLDRCVTRQEVRKALESLPEGLDETYERILLAIDKETREGKLALRALVWLVAALRPLRLTELMDGLSIDLQRRALDSEFGPMHTGALLDACGSLVTYTESTDTIILSHFSVKEYLVGELTRFKFPQHHVDKEGAHLQLARFCLCYLSLFLKSSKRSSATSDRRTNASSRPSSYDHFAETESQPLLDYVLREGLKHLAYLGPGKGTVLADMKALEADVRRYPAEWDELCARTDWISCGPEDFRPLRLTYSPAWPTSKHDFMLYVLVAYASSSLLRTFLRRTPLSPKYGTNPLVYAAYFDREEHARTLLPQGARLDRQGLVVEGSRQALPIEVTLEHHRHTILDLFLAERSPVPHHILADPLSKEYNPSKIFLPTARKLLQTDNFADNATMFVKQPISQYTLISRKDHLGTDSEENLIAVIRRLIQVGWDALACDAGGRSLLHMAVVYGYTTVTEYLLSMHIPLPPGIIFSASEADYPKRLPMLRTLVAGGADPLVRNVDGDNLLHVAMMSLFENEALNAAHFLVDHGCNALEPNARGKTPLRIAIAQGHLSATQHLVSIGAPLPPQCLLLALNSRRYRERLAMVHFLVDNGADMLVRAANGNNLLHLASKCLFENDALEVSKLFVSHGCNTLELNSRGKTPLHAAVQRGHVSVVDYLLSIRVPLPPDVLFVALNAKHSAQRLPMIQFLLQKGASVLLRTKSGKSMPHIALMSLDEMEALKIVPLLIDHGCDASEPDQKGRTLLHLAVQQGCMSIVRLLVLRDVPLPSDILFTVIKNGFSHGWVAKAVAELVAHGALVDVTREGETLLHAALQSFPTNTTEECLLNSIKELIRSGCDHNARNAAGETPLDIATAGGHVAIVAYLLSIDMSSPEVDVVRASVGG